MDIGELKSQIGALRGEIEDGLRLAAGRILEAFDDDPFEILAYRGYGNAMRARVYGRVIEKPNVSAASEGDSTLRNLLNTYRRAESDPCAAALP